MRYALLLPKAGVDSDVSDTEYEYGSEQQRIEHISKTILFARSEYFSLMFRGIMTETAADTVTVPDASPVAFDSLVDFLLADQVTIDTNTSHAFEVMQLARKYQVLRLEVCHCLFPVVCCLTRLSPRFL